MYSQDLWKLQFPSCKLLLPCCFCSEHPVPPPSKTTVQINKPPAPAMSSFADQAQVQELSAPTASPSVLSFLLAVRGGSLQTGKPLGLSLCFTTRWWKEACRDAQVPVVTLVPCSVTAACLCRTQVCQFEGAGYKCEIYCLKNRSSNLTAELHPVDED